MRNILLAMEYNGTAFHGFQTQPRLRTVQATLESTLSRHTGEQIAVRGASRTDAGVHACAQVVNFLTSNPVPTERACAAVNRLLPLDVSAWQALEVAEDFNARRCASSKAYTYLIVDGVPRPAILAPFRLHHPHSLDVDSMADSLTPLTGQHDFVAFSAKGDEPVPTVRHLLEARCWREGPVVKVLLRADGFLYRMARLIVGGLLKVGEGRWKPEKMREILLSRRREQSPPAAPAHGLYLTEVVYSCPHLKATFRKEAP